MNQIDKEKLEFYLDAEFYFQDGILFSNIVRKPSREELNSMKEKNSKQQIEKLYNHFHLQAISEDPKTQREVAVQIWNAWRHFFSIHYPEKEMVIEIHDFNIETIMYVYEIIRESSS
jgi:hypothetical protein